MKTIWGLLCLLTVTWQVAAQNSSAAAGGEWTAQWITHPDIEGTEAGVYLFRKAIELESVPTDFVVHISADNGYKLYVNDQMVSVGPARGDMNHWNYETVDLAPYLQAGSNTLAAKVWNEGALRAVAQISWQTGFFLQGAGESSEVANTDDSWKVLQDRSYTPIRQSVRGYWAAGAGELIDMNKRIRGWREASFDDQNWKTAGTIDVSNRRFGFGMDTRVGWQLVAPTIPERELKPQRLVRTRKTEGVTVPGEFPKEKAPFQVAANTTATILLDQEELTNAFVTLHWSGGAGSQIKLTYAEALYDAEGNKGNRDVIEGKEISGARDSIISDGTADQLFTTMRYRTYRYLEIEVKTEAEPLVIQDISGMYTGYPFDMKAKLFSGEEELQEMMDIGWRTAQLCAVDTYMDCPYYERLQYVGDTRIQHFVSFYNSGDDRLAKNALNLMDYSRQRGGFTLSRYPDRMGQVIPTYSLWYISMLKDYMYYGTEPAFVKDKLFGSRQILNYFINYIAEDGSLKNVPGWQFTDWVAEWRFGVAPMSEDGTSSLLDLQLLLAFQSASELESAMGDPAFADLFDSYAERMADMIQEKYWDASRGLYADTPEKDVFSQHANSLAILAGLVDGTRAREIGEKMLSDTSLAKASIYFKYYLHQALTEAGMGDDYLKWLDVWRQYMDLGMSTWGEDFEVESTRSDCHAWGSSPNVDFFRIILGIESDGIGFSKVRIEPHLGDFEEIGGEMPHPQGMVAVSYDRSGSKMEAEITLPQNVTGTFVWAGKTHSLRSGTNKLSL